MRTSGLFTLILTLIALSALGANKPTCGSTLGATSSTTASDYFDEPLFSNGVHPRFTHNTNYTKQIREQSDVHDQCELGTCTLQAWSSILEHQRPIPISTEYLSAQHWLTKSLEVLDADNLTAGVNLGGTVETSLLRMRQYGLMPQSAWKLGTFFQKEKVQPRMASYLKNIIARTKWNRDQTADPSARAKIMEKGRNQIKALFKEIIGEIPKEFIYQGKTYTPLSFAKEFYPELFVPHDHIMPDSSVGNQTTYLGFPGEEDFYVRTSFGLTEKIIKDRLDANKPVWLLYDHHPEFIDEQTGLMSISAFAPPELALPVPRHIRDQSELGFSGHAVVIVGYDVDPKTNEIIKWKIKNSWGQKSGDHGYYHMYADYFRAFADTIAFPHDPKITLPPADIHKPQQILLFD